MTPARKFMATTALGLSLMATTASADLTAAQVWNDWRVYLEGMGYTVTATPATTGNTLSVSDLAVQMSGARAMNMRIGTLDFVENGDGTVDIVMPSRLPLTIEIPADDVSPASEITLDYVQNGHKMTASGDADAMTYDYDADSFALTLASLIVDGEPVDANAARFALSGNDLTSQTDVSVGETRSYDQSVGVGSLSYDVMFNEPDNVDAVSIQSTIGAMTFSGTSTMPVGVTPQAQDITPLIASGFAFDGTFGTQDTETQVEMTSIDGTSRIKTASASSTLGVVMGLEGLRYVADARDVQIGAELAGLPVPLFAQMAQSGFQLGMPVVKSDDPQDFKLAFNMTDVTMSDIIWAMFDPAGQLPRDPATIALDLSGKAKVLSNPFDAQAVQQSAETGDLPAEVEALSINRLTLDAVGAQLEATGDVTFDNADKVTLPGFPKPVGDVNITIAGASALLDRLVAIGMLPPDQVMGARMMLGVFAVPGDAADTLNSRIEFTEAGEILANGQRIR
jgi:hypothetical protein